MQNINAPDWDPEVAAYQAEIKIAPASSYQSIADYLSAFGDINNKYFVQSGLDQFVVEAESSTTDAEANDPSIPAIAEPQISGALRAAMGMEVPASFVTFQKDWIKLLVYEKNTADLLDGEVTATDPVRAVFDLTLEEGNYNAALGSLMPTLQNAEQEEGLAVGSAETKTNQIVAFIENVFPIVRIANAQGIPLGVPVNDITNKIAIANAAAAGVQNGWAEFFENLAKNIALQLARNILMALIQQKVLKYIQNSGAPRFLTNWGTQLVNAAEQTALSAINSNFSCINVNTNLPKIQLILNAIYQPGNNACAAQFQSQLSSGNLKNFLNNFMSGGFLTFGSTLMPTENFYGSLFFAAQSASAGSQQGQSLFTMKSTASQGYTQPSECGDGSNPSGFFCSSLGAGNGLGINTNNGSSTTYVPPNGATTCNPGYNAVPNDGQCANGAEPTITMPGIVNANAVQQALGGSPKLVAAAADISGLVQAVVSSLLMSIVQQGISSVTTAVNGALAGNGGIMSINPNTITASATSTETSPLSCSETSVAPTPGAPTSFYALGGTYDASSNPPIYLWQSSDGQSATGTEFTVTYNSTGTYTITLSDSAGDTPATCAAAVGETAAGGAACSPLNQIITLSTITGQATSSLSASGGANGPDGSSPTYTWTAPGALSTSGGPNPGDTFQSVYNASNTYNVTVTASTDNSSSTCTVIVQ